MLELYSFVDYFTIPPSFVSIYLDRTWIGNYVKKKGPNFPIDQTSHFRVALPSCPSFDDCSRHIAIPQHFKDVNIHPLGTTYIYFHFSLADSSWDHPLGEYCMSLAMKKRIEVSKGGYGSSKGQRDDIYRVLHGFN